MYMVNDILKIDVLTCSKYMTQAREDGYLNLSFPEGDGAYESSNNSSDRGRSGLWCAGYRNYQKFDCSEVS